MTINARGKVFRCPVHGLIRIDEGDEFIISLIDAPEFQRLRRVRQLGVSSLTYPGAEHTRFAHSLGVFNFAQRILGVLNRRYISDGPILAILKENDQIVKAAALLHDIGHGPFSHMIERAFPSVADHEKKTVTLIREKGSIPEILTKHGIDPKAVASLVLKANPYRFLSDIVSSQLDADRMDYILRDALNTGVKYGNFDADWVVNSLCLGIEPNTNTADLKNLRLCLEERRGLHSAEQLVMARMHMSFQLYYHRATRGWEAHMLCLLGLANRLAKEGRLPAGTPSSVERFLVAEGGLDGDDWLWFDESAKEAALHAWAAVGGANAELAEMSRAFLLRKKLFVCAEIGAPSTAQTLHLTRALDGCGRENVDWLLDDPPFTSYRDYDATFRSSRKLEDKGAVATGAILVSDGELSHSARPAEAASMVLEALGENPKGTRLSMCRLFFHQKLTRPIRNILVESASRSRFHPLMHPIIPLLQLVHVLQRIDGRKKLQKTVHILKEFGANFSEPFEYSTYGMYSMQLKQEVSILESEGLVREHPVNMFGNPSYFIEAGSGLENLVNEFSVPTPPWADLAKHLNKLSPQKLEAISTILFLRHEEVRPDSIRKRLIALKPHLEGIAGECFQELDELDRQYSQS